MKLPSFLIFLTRFGVCGIPRITPASEASHEFIKLYLRVPEHLPHPSSLLRPELLGLCGGRLRSVLTGCEQSHEPPPDHIHNL